ncbi:MAG: GlyGly-CTERM sorting domain-containing protein [Mesorhizobium sp.]|nr:MAG: GlyGly-CTERM sorting domain-containing protein [Mesorhizobium sp.]
MSARCCWCGSIPWLTIPLLGGLRLARKRPLAAAVP